jgi:hypothetical protein
MNAPLFTSPACGRGRREAAGEGRHTSLTAPLRFAPLPQAGEVKRSPC